MSLGDALDKTTVELGVEATGVEAAGASFNKLQGSLAKLSDVGGKMGEQLGEAGQKVSEAEAKVKQVWDPASQSFIQVAAAANQAAQGVEKVTQKMGPLQSAATKVSGAIDDMKGKLLGIQVAASVFMYSAIGAAAEVERLENTTKAAFGEGAKDILAWADAGGKLTGVTNESRLAMAQMFKTAKMGNEEIMTTTELVEKYWQNKALRTKLTEAGIGSKEDLAKQIKNVEIGGGKAFGLKQIWGKDALDDVIQNGHGAKKVLSLMRKDLEKTADTSDDTMSAQADLSEAWGEFTENAGKGLLGPMTFIFKKLTQVIQLIDSIPGGATVAGLGAGFAFIGVSLVFLIGMLANAIISITTLIGAERLAALQSKAWAAAQYLSATASTVAAGAVGALTGALTVLKAAMLSNPITAAFVILLAVLILLETKFHIFSNLFKSLEKVDWAGKWASSVEYLTGLWDGLIDRVSWVRGLVSGGMGALSKLGGGNIAVGGMMVAIPGIGLLVVLLRALVGHFKGLAELQAGALTFLRNIYDALKQGFDRALSFLGSLLPDWLSKLFDSVGGFVTWLQDAWQSLIGGINAFLASIPGVDYQIEAKKAGTEEKTTGLSVEERNRILENNLTAYNVDQVAGSQLGTPAIGAGNVKGWEPAFGGDYAGYNFQSSRYPDVQRSGKDLTEEQLLSGEWTPKNAVDEFGGYMGALTDAQIKAFNDKMAAIKAAKIEVKADKAEITVTETQQKARDKLAARTEPKAGEERSDEEYATDKQDAIDAGIVEAGSQSYKGSEITGSNWNWGSQPKEKSSEASKPAASPLPSSTSSLPDVTGMLGGEDKSSSSSESSTPSAPAASSTPASSSSSEKTADQKAYDDAWNRADEGGRITRTGRGTIHEGEEVVSEKDKLMYNTGEVPSILESIDLITAKLRQYASPLEAAPQAAVPVAAPATAIKQGDKTVNLYGPFVKVDKIDNRLDLDRMQTDLIKFLRGEIKSAMKG